MLRNAPASSAGQHATLMYIIQLEMQHSCLALRPTCCTVAASTALHNSRTCATHAYAIDIPSLVIRTRSCRACCPVQSTSRQCGCSTAHCFKQTTTSEAEPSAGHASEMPRSCFCFSFSLAHAPHESSPGGIHTISSNNSMLQCGNRPVRRASAGALMRRMPQSCRQVRRGHQQHALCMFFACHVRAPCK
jgi:hypothetical protein